MPSKNVIISTFSRSRESKKHKRRSLAFAITLWTLATLAGSSSVVYAAEADPDRGVLLMLVEPSFMRPAFAEPIPGSTKTVTAPAVIRGDFVTYVDDDMINRLGLKPESIQRVARANASAELKMLTPRYLRDDKGVVQAAIIDSDRPVVAATVLAQDFIKTFEDVFGPDILVAIPNRYRVYIYPALASQFEATADAVIADFHLTPFPVSQEVFRVTASGLEAVGTFEKEDTPGGASPF